MDLSLVNEQGVPTHKNGSVLDLCWSNRKGLKHCSNWRIMEPLVGSGSDHLTLGIDLAWLLPPLPTHTLLPYHYGKADWKKFAAFLTAAQPRVSALQLSLLPSPLRATLW